MQEGRWQPHRGPGSLAKAVIVQLRRIFLSFRCWEQAGLTVPARLARHKIPGKPRALRVQVGLTVRLGLFHTVGWWEGKGPGWRHSSYPSGMASPLQMLWGFLITPPVLGLILDTGSLLSFGQVIGALCPFLSCGNDTHSSLSACVEMQLCWELRAVSLVEKAPCISAWCSGYSWLPSMGTILYCHPPASEAQIPTTPSSR